MSLELPIRLLLVEDNPSDAFLLRMTLSRSRDFEFNLMEVERVSDAIAALRTHSFHAIITDLHLPDSTGAETIHVLAKAAAGLPIIALTGWDDRVLGARLVTEGATCYWSKDRIHGTDLVNAIVDLIQRHSTPRSFANGRNTDPKD